MRFYGWDPLMVSHGPGKFGDYMHCGSRDMFLVAEEENSRCSCFNLSLLFNPPLLFNLPLLFISNGHGLKAQSISYYQLQSWSHTLKAAIGKNFENNFCQSVQKHHALQANAKIVQLVILYNSELNFNFYCIAIDKIT